MTRERRFRIETVVARAFILLGRLFPRVVFVRWGRLLGRLWAAIDRKHVRIAEENLRASFADWPEDKIKNVARSVWVHFGGVMFDLVRVLGRGGRVLEGLWDVDFPQHATAAHASGRGVVLVTAHFGSWEAHGIIHGKAFAPIGVVARPLDNPFLDAAMTRVREAAGNDVIEKEHALIRSLRRIKQGGAVAFLIDQNVQEKEGIFVRFFGRDACTTPFAAKLAIRSGALILPCRTSMTPDLRYRVSYDAPIDPREYTDDEAGVQALTQRMTTLIEAWIRETPEQWLWMHRRWHTTPKP